jgi:hypothetical protein
VRAGAGAASCRDEADADARKERERRTVEESVEVVVVDLAELEEVLARPRAGLDLEVDDQVPKRRLEQHRHARLSPAQVQKPLHEYASQRARRVECRVGVNVEDKLARSGPPLLSLPFRATTVSCLIRRANTTTNWITISQQKRDSNKSRDHCPCNRKKKREVPGSSAPGRAFTRTSRAGSCRRWCTPRSEGCSRYRPWSLREVQQNARQRRCKDGPVISMHCPWFETCPPFVNDHCCAASPS